MRGAPPADATRKAGQTHERHDPVFPASLLMTPVSSFNDQLEAYRLRFENALEKLSPAPETRPARLHSAMHYSLHAGGKRMRPCLLLGAFDCYPADIDPMPAAVSLEALHTYTLIHDDLPCMDDSDLRRGRPTCHRAFDEATALLAGDGLLTWAFYFLAEAYSEHPEIVTGLILDLGKAAGSEQLIGGQMEDLLGEKEDPTPDRLQFIHENKTAALITASLTMGTRLSAAPDDLLPTMRTAGWHLGLAFQIIDDVLDVTSDAATLGKPAGADSSNNKMTYPALFGIKASREKAFEHTRAAQQLCREVGGNNAFLLELINFLEKRAH